MTEAEDGGIAAEICAEKQGAFDLLLSDIKMPVMDGIALALTIAAQFPELTILLMTGFADQRERAHGLEALIYDVVPKPFSLQVLLEKVDDALRASAGNHLNVQAGDGLTPPLHHPLRREWAPHHAPPPGHPRESGDLCWRWRK